jgi:glutamyl-tRNA synthetase
MVRVRFAPSPTGHLHVGGARTALFNYLFARGRGGAFILRSDDTDQERSTSEFQEDIIGGLRWLGLEWDEGIEAGGVHGTYYQSDRTAHYREVALGLVAEGKAYYSFVTAAQLDDFRNEARAAGTSPAYDGRHRVDAAEAQRRVDAGEQATVRFAVPRPGATVVDDVVRGEVRFDHVQVDDFVILRSDGTPTYHLASTVDDVDYGITHVIRGEDLLSSTPKHILLTQAMGAEPATYAHLSLLLGPDGKKLSKRHGHTALRAYREGGYLPEAVVNYLALLGWSPGDDETVVSLEEMIHRFDLATVSRNPAIFDPDKLEWMNGVYIRDLPAAEFAARARAVVEADLGRSLEPEESAAFENVAPLVQERVKLLTEVPPQVAFLLGDVVYDERSWEKVMTKPNAPEAVGTAVVLIEELEEWEPGRIETTLRGMLELLDLSAREGLQPVRVAIAGSAVSPPLFESIYALGRERTVARLREAQRRLA